MLGVVFAGLQIEPLLTNCVYRCIHRGKNSYHPTFAYSCKLVRSPGVTLSELFVVAYSDQRLGQLSGQRSDQRRVKRRLATKAKSIAFVHRHSIMRVK
jgi:hypothetical protein